MSTHTTAAEVAIRAREAESRIRLVVDELRLAYKHFLMTVMFTMIQLDVDEEGCGAFFAAYKEQLWSKEQG